MIRSPTAGFQSTPSSFRKRGFRLARAAPKASPFRSVRYQSGTTIQGGPILRASSRFSPGFLPLFAFVFRYARCGVLLLAHDRLESMECVEEAASVPLTFWRQMPTSDRREAWDEPRSSRRRTVGRHERRGCETFKRGTAACYGSRSVDSLYRGPALPSLIVTVPNALHAWLLSLFISFLRFVELFLILTFLDAQ